MPKAAGILVVFIILVIAGYSVLIPFGEEGSTRRTLKVIRGDVIRLAVATGNVGVELEVPVKSPTGGILTKLFVKQGQKVSKGAELAEVRPVLTARTFVQAERALITARDGEAGAKEFLDGDHLAGIFARMFMGKENLERSYRQAALGRKAMEEELALIREGKIDVDDRSLDFTVRAPVDGHVLDVVLREGGPVVPSSSYGSGSVLVVLADLDSLLFRGTVDEIDVGRLTEGMTAHIRVGALPDVELTGKLSEIDLRSQRINDAVVFEVRVDLVQVPGVVLRSGYSAVAEIEIARKTDVLVLPERVVDYRRDGSFVRIPDGADASQERKVETGLSDGLRVEILSGLAEGDIVLERNGSG